MAAHTLRTLEAQHLDAFLRVDARACGLSQHEVRSRSFVAAIIKLHPALALGAWAGESLVGAVIGMALGTVGAVLHCCVDPDHQRQGVGTQLMTELIRTLTQRVGVCIVQLPSAASWEIAWLSQMGFYCAEPQIVMRKSVSECPHVADRKEPFHSQWSDHLGLADAGPEMEHEQLGRLVPIGGTGQYAGMLFLETSARRQASASSSTAISFGNVMRTLSCDCLVGALARAQEITFNCGRRQIVLAINSVYGRELEALLKGGWSIVRTCHRMVQKRSLVRYRQVQAQPQVDLSHWSL